MVVSNSLSVRQTEQFVKKALNGFEDKDLTENKKPINMDVQEFLRAKIGKNLYFEQKNTGNGKLVI